MRRAVLDAFNWLMTLVGVHLFRFRELDVGPALVWESDLLVEPDVAPAVTPADVPAPAALDTKGARSVDSTSIGSAWTFKDLLETLDFYMSGVRSRVVALYGHSYYLDRAGWHGLKRMTAHCMAAPDDAATRRYDYLDTVGWPSQGAVCIWGGDRVNSDRVPVNACYFLRHTKLPWYVRGPPGVVYEFVMTYTGEQVDNEQFPCRSFVTFDASGQPQPCQVLDVQLQRVHLPPPKHRVNNHGNRTITHVTRQWRDFDDLLRERGRCGPWFTRFSPWVLNTHAQRAFTPLVVVRDGWMRASFGVALEQAPRFFKDRGITVVNRRGRRTPIIHWVRAHNKVRDGRVIATRMHLRGERQFKWRGYQVSVVIPGLHAPFSWPVDLAVTEYARDEWAPPDGVPLRRAAEEIEQCQEGVGAPTLSEVRRQA